MPRSRPQVNHLVYGIEQIALVHKRSPSHDGLDVIGNAVGNALRKTVHTQETYAPTLRSATRRGECEFCLCHNW